MHPSRRPATVDAEATDLSARRDALVHQLRAAGALRSAAVEAAIRAVPRHLFVPTASVAEAYADEAIVTRTGPDGLPTSSASQPSIVAIMLEQLAVVPGQRVLEIGAGTGYNAALLAHLVGSSGRVTSVDIDAETAQAARDHLAAADATTVDVVAADGWGGHAAGAPFDRIEATVGVWDLSSQWFDQLVNGGVLVAPLWLGPGLQVSVAFEKLGRQFRSRSVIPCGFMRLRGTAAGPESYRRVGDWVVSAERLGAEDVAVLGRLLDKPPNSQPAPPVPRGWQLRLALAGPRALLLVDETHRRVAGGLFDPVAGSLVLAKGTGGWLGHWTPETVQCHGEEHLLPELTALLQAPDSLEVGELELLAARRGDPLPEGGSGPTWVLERPQHRFLVRAGAA